MYKIITYDEDCEEWRDANESDGLDCQNEFGDFELAKSEARRIVNRCSYHFKTKVVKA